MTLYLSDEQQSSLHTLRIDWSVCCALMSIAAAVMLPVYTRFVREWDQHHPIVQASVCLVLPDLLLVINFLPLEAMNLAVDHFASQNYCIFSAFATVSGIVASNAGVIYISYTTYAVIVLGQRKTNYRTLIGAQVIGWAMGISLASYYYSQDYLGIYLGLYCCTKTKHQLDIVIPVFLTFFIASTTMGILYYKTFAHIREVENKAADLKGRPQQQQQQQGMMVPLATTVAPRSAQVGQVAMFPLAARNPAASAPPRPLTKSHDQSRRGSATSPLPGMASAGGGAAAGTGTGAGAASGDASSPDGSVVVHIGGVGSTGAEAAAAAAAAGEESKLGGGGDGGNGTRAWSGSAAVVPSQTPLGASLQQGETQGPPAAPLIPASVVDIHTAVTPEARRAAMTERKTKSLALSMLKRGLGLIGVYYFCWFFVSLNGALALGGVDLTSLWPEMIAAWLIKLSPLIDALILGDLMRRASANRAGAARAVGGVAGTRVDVSATGSSAGSSAAEPMVVRRVMHKGAAVAGGGAAGAAKKRASGSYNVAGAGTGAGAAGAPLPLAANRRNPSSSQLGTPVHLGRRIIPSTGGSGSATPTHARGGSVELQQQQLQQQQQQGEHAAGESSSSRPLLPPRGSIGGGSGSAWSFPGLTAISDAPGAHGASVMSPSHGTAAVHSRASSSFMSAGPTAASSIAGITLVTPLLAPVSGSESDGNAIAASDSIDLFSSGPVVPAAAGAGMRVPVPGVAPSPVAEDPAAELDDANNWPTAAK